MDTILLGYITHKETKGYLNKDLSADILSKKVIWENKFNYFILHEVLIFNVIFSHFLFCQDKKGAKAAPATKGKEKKEKESKEAKETKGKKKEAAAPKASKASDKGDKGGSIKGDGKLYFVFCAQNYLLKEKE